MSRSLRAGALGCIAAAMPLAAFATESAAAETASRSLPAAVDGMTVALVAVLAVLAILVLAGLGYLYRRERHLDWEFQRPDSPHGEGGHH